MSFKELIHKIILDIRISDNDNELSFLIDTRKSSPDKKIANWPVDTLTIPYIVMKYTSEGECCNNVWFSDYVDIENLITSTIFEVEEKPWIALSSHDDGYEDMYLESAFWTFKTSKGYTDIEVRNSHNGYYGGHVEFSGISTDLSIFMSLDNPTFNQQKLINSIRKGTLEYTLETKPSRAIKPSKL